MRKLEPIGGHAVATRDRAQRHHVIVGAPVSHHANRLDGQQDRERLPDLVVQSGRADLVEIDRVDLPQEVQPLFTHGPQHPDRQARPGERMPAHDLLG